MDNPGGVLRPGMYATVLLTARVPAVAIRNGAEAVTNMTRALCAVAASCPCHCLVRHDGPDARSGVRSRQSPHASTAGERPAHRPADNPAAGRGQQYRPRAGAEQALVQAQAAERCGDLELCAMRSPAGSATTSTMARCRTSRATSLNVNKQLHSEVGGVAAQVNLGDAIFQKLSAQAGCSRRPNTPSPRRATTRPSRRATRLFRSGQRAGQRQDRRGCGHAFRGTIENQLDRAAAHRPGEQKRCPAGRACRRRITR